MKGLLVKDIRVLTQQKKLVIIYIALALMLSFAMDPTFIVGYLTMIGMILTYSTISYDDFDNGMPFLMTLPVTGKTYAREKYALSAIAIGTSWIFAVALQTGSLMVKGDPFNAAEILTQDLIFLPLYLIVTSFMIPIELKFGTEKGRLVLFVIFGIGMALVFLAEKIKPVFEDSLKGLVRLMDSQSPLVLVAGSVVITIVLMFISMAVSAGIMDKKEY